MQRESVILVLAFHRLQKAGRDMKGCLTKAFFCHYAPASKDGRIVKMLPCASKKYKISPKGMSSGP